MTTQKQADAILGRVQTATLIEDVDELMLRLAQDRAALLKAAKFGLAGLDGLIDLAAIRRELTAAIAQAEAA